LTFFKHGRQQTFMGVLHSVCLLHFVLVMLTIDTL
jgi:hypothetical protein